MKYLILCAGLLLAACAPMPPTGPMGPVAEPIRLEFPVCRITTPLAFRAGILSFNACDVLSGRIFISHLKPRQINPREIF